MSYSIKRIYFEDGSHQYNRVIKTGLTLTEAQAHCSDPETSSSTCTRSDRKRITRERGKWFDTYHEV